ncbi:histidine kinase [Novosphingobium nitrogenifigens DSM 19370]|uniref:histidine kinase n=1 Tax=Novosphingobium nitrogenifigens DSM 19370 TaxID=983920 RepID=F1Z726_9SPHN|nr:ATP-binding protein [Novosphingobium nitrogenifigens]EGD59630.1 histidine kinase [Novosphingobium nitrogenifigens DSM 19370]
MALSSVSPPADSAVPRAGGDYVLRDKRAYNKWVASETMEDYALRYTAASARRWSAGRVAGTAIGATAFLACEAIGGSITLAFGFANAVAAIAATVAIMFALGFAIALHAARHGLDIDLLTRGGGFGYLGSTITSLVYASFTFLLFSVEASIMANALVALLGLPLALAYLVSALVVIPIAFYGMSAITRFQRATQGVWIALQLAPIAYIGLWQRPALAQWAAFPGLDGGHGGLSLIPFGFAVSTLLSLLPQIGEQADYLRFMPRPARPAALGWWSALVGAGPGWALIGGGKLLLGSFLAHYLLQRGFGPAAAQDPIAMFRAIFTAMTGNGWFGLALAGVLVVVCQMKINVTNAYAGSIAWSNFFARLTHNHPGRVVWMLFNVGVAVLLMEFGIGRLMTAVLPVYASLAAGWIGALAADLMVSKPLGLSPAGIEFKRAHLYDLNPVGVGAMALSILVSLLAWLGFAGDVARAFAPVLGLGVAFVAAPLIALATRGRWYIARRADRIAEDAMATCTICENAFDAPDMAFCPLHRGAICSLCCTLEARCHDRCKVDSRATEQVAGWLEHLLPAALGRHVHSPLGHFAMVMTAVAALETAIVGGVTWRLSRFLAGDALASLRETMLIVLVILLFLGGVAGWIVVLVHQSRRAALKEADHHVSALEEEIAAHGATTRELHRAKEAAESANAAKSRYLLAVSHEIRSPLNSIYGYAQLMERGHDIAPAEAARIIRRSSEHLTNLVEGLLDISHVESGVLRISNDTVRLQPFLDQIASMFVPQAQAKGIAFDYRCTGHIPTYVRTDQKRLRQILINLLSNAIKFTQAGSVRFTVAFRPELATFTIADTGIGIAAEDRERIFAPFERGSHPEAQRQRGIGLGLAITAALVHILGGDIQVESVPGKGATFTVRLRLGQVMGAADPAAGEVAQAIEGYEGAQRSILLIDDDPDQLRLLRSLLEPLGFAVHAAPDGAKGLALAQAEQPELVLCDVSMPGLSGWDVAKALRETFGEAIRIVMVSADAHDLRRHAGSASHDMFLIKPVELGTLLDVVGRELKLRWTGATVPEALIAATPDPAEKLPEAARAYLTEIESGIRIGDVRGIEQSVRALEQAVPEAHALAGHLLACLDRFDLAGLAAAIRDVT